MAFYKNLVPPAGLSQQLHAMAKKGSAFPLPWSESQLGLLLEDPHVDLYLWKTEKIQAFALVRRVLDEAELFYLTVDPDSRQQGLGFQFLSAIIRDLSHSQVKTFFLEVRASNQGARALYKKAGFTEVGQRKNYYQTPRETAILMKRTMKEDRDD